jgi:hypothetical protein
MTEAERAVLKKHLKANRMVRALAPATFEELLGRSVMEDERQDVAAVIRSVHPDAAIVPLATVTGKLDVAW